MGLFDIFKRKSKKEHVEEPSVTTSEVNQPVEDQKVEQPAPATNEEIADLDTKQVSTDEQVVDSVEPAAVEAQPEEPKEDSEITQAVEATDAPTVMEIKEPTVPADSDTVDKPEEVVADSVSESVNEEPLAEEEEVPTAEQPEAVIPEDTQEPDEPAEEVSPAPKPATDNDTAAYDQGLSKSRSTFGAKLNALLANFRRVDEDFFEDLEDMLIESDVGFETAMQITDELKDEVKLQNAKKPKDVQNVIIKKMIDLYDQAGDGEQLDIKMAPEGPTVILFVGVNGVGKTTTIGKMAKMYKDQGKKVLLVAADTFRAGAIEQLNVWAQRDGVDIVKGKVQGDPSAAVFDGVKKALAEQYDILLVDTAGRLQNKVNLMNELAKMKKVLTREIPAAPHEVLLVLDATTGQNAMTQAKTFKEATDVTGIVLTKLDGTARGGIVLAIRNELHLPVKYVGLGEKVTDLKIFSPSEFVYGLFKGLINE